MFGSGSGSAGRALGAGHRPPELPQLPHAASWTRCPGPGRAGRRLRRVANLDYVPIRIVEAEDSLAPFLGLDRMDDLSARVVDRTERPLQVVGLEVDVDVVVA